MNNTTAHATTEQTRQNVTAQAAARQYGTELGWLCFPAHGVDEAGRCTCGKPDCGSQGKHPACKSWKQDATNDPEKLADLWGRRSGLNLGVVCGEASGVVVLDIDPRNGGDDSLEKMLAEFGPLPTTAKVLTGGGGEHYFFRHPGWLVRCRPDLRPGVDLKADGGYVVGPPSGHKSGGVYRFAPGLAPQQVGIADAPEWLWELIEGKPKALMADGPQALGAAREESNGAIREGGRNATLTSCAGSMRRKGMSREAILAALLVQNQEQCSPPLDAGEVEQIAASVANYEPAAEQVERPTISNYSIEEVEGDDGKAKRVNIPRPLGGIIRDIGTLTGGWPRRVDNAVFVDDPVHGLGFFDRRGSAGLFGWLRRKFDVRWARGGDFAGQAELFAEIERTAVRYDGIENMPHEPPLPATYYRGTAPPPGDGSHLQRLLDRYRPETTADRDLLQAAFMTPAWGGLPGCRPCFVFTADAGRGSGKTAAAGSVGYLYGGYLDLSAGENIENLKARLLSPSSRTKRVALLDNIKTHRLSWAELESLITSPVISGRQLYTGEAQRPNVLTYIMTLNGVALSADMAQRSVVVKLAKGENQGSWLEDTRRYIDEHREQILGDIIAALRGPQHPLPSFSRWATWEQEVLSRLPEPAEAQRVILERQQAADTDLDEGDLIEQFFSDQLRRLGYDPAKAQVRVPVAQAARWTNWATNSQDKVAAISRRLNQMAAEGQLKRLSSDSSRTYGRCFVWTGEHADVLGSTISNDLAQRLAEMQNDECR